jgi:hypothetical protein
MKVRILIATLLMALGLQTAQAQIPGVNKTKVWSDRVDEHGYRIIETDLTSVLTPKGFLYAISISLNYYQGFKCPYFIRLYGRPELTDDDRLTIALSNGKELHLYPSGSDLQYSRLGLIKKVPVYQAFYPLDEDQLSDLLSASVVAISMKIKTGSKAEWHSKELKDGYVDKWLKLNYKAIQKRLNKKK